MLGAIALLASDPVAAGSVPRASAVTYSLHELVAQHRAIRVQLDRVERDTLDRLTARFRSLLVGRRLQMGLWEAALSALEASGVELDERERSVLATYLLDAIAARDDLADLRPTTKNSIQPQEAQMSFNVQYLQLQFQLQHENRSYELVRNIMKAKHDTVKNCISNVR